MGKQNFSRFCLFISVSKRLTSSNSEIGKVKTMTLFPSYFEFPTLIRLVPLLHAAKLWDHDLRRIEITIRVAYTWTSNENGSGSRCTRDALQRQLHVCLLRLLNGFRTRSRSKKNLHGTVFRDWDEDPDCDPALWWGRILGDHNRDQVVTLHTLFRILIVVWIAMFRDASGMKWNWNIPEFFCSV